MATPTMTSATAADVDTEEEREDSFAEISSAVLVNENIDAHTVFHNVTLLVTSKHGVTYFVTYGVTYGVTCVAFKHLVSWHKWAFTFLTIAQWYQYLFQNLKSLLLIVYFNIWVSKTPL